MVFMSSSVAELIIAPICTSLGSVVGSIDIAFSFTALTTAVAAVIGIALVVVYRDSYNLTKPKKDQYDTIT